MIEYMKENVIILCKLKLYWNDDKYYEGKFLNNRQHGKGV